jgi:cysteine-S-conjugate beta-lyase
MEQSHHVCAKGIALHWRSRLLHSQAKAPEGFRSLVTPTYRGSTVLFDRQADVNDDWRQAELGYTYGLYGTPTVLELAARIADLEGARHTFVVPGGQAAIALIYLSLCRSGSHALVPTSAYGPNRQLAQGLLRRLGIEVEPYDPLAGSGLASLIRANTALIWCESPGSVTMEIQDLPAIVAAAHERDIPVALDNTYAAGVLLDAFSLGVDISMQALTKYVGGHSDLLLGTVSVNDEAGYNAVGAAHAQLGMAVSPDDCSLALRGLETLGVRLERLESSTLMIARWMQSQSGIETVLHPALPSCPGHEFWQRDFSGSASVFSIVFESRFSPEQVNSFVDALKLFGIGFSWGGTHSLAVAFPGLERPNMDYAGRIVRFNIGLEEPSDLIADLSAALQSIS